MTKEYLFSQMTLPPELVEDLRRQNPWWEGRALPELPSHRRHLVGQIQRRLEWKLAPIVAVRGPRQVGKTTAQLHWIEDALKSGVEGRRILRVQFDDVREMGGFDSPILRLADWFERTILGSTFNEAARSGRPAFVLLDHGLRASWLQERIPLDIAGLREHPELTGVAGHLAESVTGALLFTIEGLDVAHFPERPDEPEVDFVLTIGVKRIPIEVKYQARVDPMRDTEGLRSFIERAVNNAPFGLLIVRDDSPRILDPRIVALPLSSLMLLR